MKICTIICEFNPFHNGHAYLLQEARKLSGCDMIVCIMSGSFTQRGEVAVFDKYARAQHAVKGGADAVVELPAPFSVAPAELFAAGGVKIASSFAEAEILAFGSECGDADKIRVAAQILVRESDEFKRALGERLGEGDSYIRAYAAAFESVGGDGTILSSPNDLLAVEYAKAILRSGSKLNMLPVKRIGGAHGDLSLGEKYASATAIRNAIGTSEAQKCVPNFVKLPKTMSAKENFAILERADLLRATSASLDKIAGCTEGLSSALLNAAGENMTEEVIEKCTSRRYSASRISRILCANSLKIVADDYSALLSEPLYVRPLAVNENKKDEIYAALAKSAFPLITRGRDREKLTPAARRAIELDDLAHNLRNALNQTKRAD